MRQACILLLSSLAVAAGVDFTSYRPAYSHISRLDWGLGLTGSSGNVAINDTAHSSGLATSLRPGIAWQTRTQSDRFDLDAGLPLDLRIGYETWTQPHRFLRATSITSYCYPGVDVRWYPGLADLHVAGSLTGRAALYRDHTFYVDDDTFIEYESDDDIDVTLDAGVGYGRMRDAWPLVKAVRIVGLLQEDRVLARALTDAEIHDLAGFISRSWTLFYNHDRPHQFYYDSLEVYLLGLGAIERPLPAYSLFRLDEDLYIGSDTCRFGWRVSGLIEHRASAEWGRRRGTDTATYFDSSLTRSTRFTLEYARPFGLYWTTTALLEYASPWLALPRPTDVIHDLTLELTAGRMVADRVGFRATAGAQGLYRPRPSPRHFDRLDLTTSVRVSGDYYVAERLRVGVSLGWSGNGWRIWDETYNKAELKQVWTMSIHVRFGRIPWDWTDPIYIL